MNSRTNYLGNVRVAFSDRNGDNFIELLGTANQVEITQQVDYYPFGLQQQGAGLFHVGQEPTNRYRFNGIEHEESGGLDLAMYRSYDPTLGRFQQIDPFAEVFSSSSAYAFVENNPISYADPLGLFKTKFGVWLHKLFNGGDEILKGSKSGEWFVGTERKEKNAVVYTRVFRRNSEKPSGGLTNAINALPSNLNFATEKFVQQGGTLENAGDGISGFGIAIPPIAPEAGAPLIAAGGTISTMGVGMQVAEIVFYMDHNTQLDKLEAVVKKIAVEALPAAAGTRLKKIIGNMDLTKEEKAILESVIEGEGYLLEKVGEGGVEQVVESLFDQIRNQ